MSTIENQRAVIDALSKVLSPQNPKTCATEVADATTQVTPALARKVLRELKDKGFLKDEEVVEAQVRRHYYWWANDARRREALASVRASR